MLTGLTCPRCGGSKLRVFDTDKTDEGIRRRRSCDSCGERITTVETLIDGVPGRIATAAAQRRTAASLRNLHTQVVETMDVQERRLLKLIDTIDASAERLDPKK